MIHAPPRLDPADARVLAAIDDLEARLLALGGGAPTAFDGPGHRRAFGRAMQLSAAADALGGEATFEVEDAGRIGDPEAQAKLRGAMRLLESLFEARRTPLKAIDVPLIQKLHAVLMTTEDAATAGAADAGLWRSGRAKVRRVRSGAAVYVAPDAARIPDLMAALAAQIADETVEPRVAAALAHLNLVKIHPFSDGNGRIGRALQTLLVARRRQISPAVASLEPWFQRHYDAYIDGLSGIDDGAFRPERDALAWVRLCLTAHHQHFETLIRRIDGVWATWRAVEARAAALGLEDRCARLLLETAFGRRITTTDYAAEEAIAPGAAAAELEILTTGGWLTPSGGVGAEHLGPESFGAEGFGAEGFGAGEFGAGEALARLKAAAAPAFTACDPYRR